MNKFSKGMGSDGDDFQFKPITEGLGFHKKKIELRDDLAAQMKELATTDILPKARNPQSKFQMNFSDSSAHKPLTSTAPLPKINPTPAKPLAPKPAAPVGKAQWSPAIENVEITEEATQHWKPVATAWASGFFDSLMVVGIGLIFTAAVFAVTGIELEELAEMLRYEIGAQMAMAFLLFAVLELYGVSSRVLFGATLGEWTFGLRMGTEADQKSILFPVKLTWRILLNSLTGFILLPLISTILEVDVAGKMSGLELYSEEI